MIRADRRSSSMHTIGESSLAGAEPWWMESWGPAIASSEWALIPTNALNYGDFDRKWADEVSSGKGQRYGHGADPRKVYNNLRKR